MINAAIVIKKNDVRSSNFWKTFYINIHIIVISIPWGETFTTTDVQKKNVIELEEMKLSVKISNETLLHR